MHALEEQTDVGLVGHADAAMKLDRLTADEGRAGGELVLRRAHAPSTLDPVLVDAHHRFEADGPQKLDLDEHVDRAVL